MFKHRIRRAGMGPRRDRQGEEKFMVPQVRRMIF
jgi:hypothetical protein